MLLHRSSRKKGDGAQRQWGMVMGWVRGRLLEMSGSPSLELTPFLATIEEGTNSRKIDGVVTHPWKYRFRLYYL